MTDRIRRLLQHGVDQQVFPGAVWACGGLDSEECGAVGVLDPARPAQTMRIDTIFDLASLTKVLAVWAPLGVLFEQRRVRLDDPLGRLLPDLADYPLGAVTVGHLLTHTAGVPLRANLRQYGTTREAVERGVMRESLHQAPGQAVQYTDRAALILGFLLERLVDEPLDELARTHAWAPLGMDETRFGPLSADQVERCAPTERDPETGEHRRGAVHDYSARLLDDVCGIAGAFGTAADLSHFLRYLLEPEAAPTPPDFGRPWIDVSLRVQTGELEPKRGLFWLPAPGTDPADDVYTHYGFTGTAMWVSRRSRRWAVLLTNKLYHSRERGPISEIRDAFRATVFPRVESV